MSSKCQPSTDHQLCITLSLNGALTIEFPHDEWATAFCNSVLKSPGEKLRSSNPYIRGEDSCHVRLNLKEAVNRVQFLGTDEYGGSVIFAFTDVNTAQEWLKYSGLLVDAGGDKLKLPARWSHETFDRKMKISNENAKSGVKKKKKVATTASPSRGDDE